jgi:signal transduction histidine kinase
MAGAPWRGNGANVSTPAAVPAPPEPVRALVEAGRLVALGELTPGLAHELNNPLFAILALVEFLLLEAVPGSKAHSRLDLIQTTGNEIKGILKAVLEFAREPAGRRPLDLAETVAEAVALIRSTSAWKGVELVERYPAGAPGIVVGNAGELKQVVVHLVANAVAAMDGAGTVTIGVAVGDGFVDAVVCDTGAGIPADVLPQVFEPFFTTGAGSGLGLPAARAIAQDHGGELAVESTPNVGTTFRLRLPLAPEAR